MKAKEFIEKFGWGLACRDIASLEHGFIKSEDFLEHYGFEIPGDLKQYTDAWELVDKFGGLFSLNCTIEAECPDCEFGHLEYYTDGEITLVHYKVVLQALQLVESIEVKK